MKPVHEHLHLYEEILLLALRDHEGTIAEGTTYHYALGGALLAELLLCKRLSADCSSSKKLVDVVSDAAVGNDLLDECLAKVVTTKRRASLQAWVQRFSGIHSLKHRAAERLCTLGILRMDEDRVLWIFPRTIYPELDPRPEQKLIDRITRAIESDGHVDVETIVLVALAHHAGILKHIVDRRQLKARKARIHQLIEGNLPGDAVKGAIQAMQAAVCAAAIVPMIAAS